MVIFSYYESAQPGHPPTGKLAITRSIACFAGCLHVSSAGKVNLCFTAACISSALTKRRPAERAHTYSTGLQRFRIKLELNELDQNCHSTVALTLTDLDDSCVTTVTGSVLRSDLVEQLVCKINFLCVFLLTSCCCRNLCYVIKSLLPSVFLHEVWTACPS